jgi:hypothetical protein
LLPGAWPVDEPSKFHSGRSSRLSTFLERVWRKSQHVVPDRVMPEAFEMVADRGWRGIVGLGGLQSPIRNAK